MLEIISQFVIATLGTTAIILVAKKNKWGFVVGFASQPFWIFTAIYNKQLGVLFVSIICTGSWAFGVYEWFFKKEKSGNIESKIKPGKYRHYKGKEYEVIGIGKDSEILADVVIYRGLYKSDEFGDNPLWSRPIESFLEKVDVDGKEVLRFEYIG